MRKEKTLPAGAAAETVEDALLRRHREGRLGLGVERAEPRKISPLLGQLDVLAHHLLDGSGVFDLQELVFGDKSHLKAGFRFSVLRFLVKSLPCW